ncbi:MAG TPA: hypothetical protein VFE63_13975, partial [Roseiarcus sp.]|nr:hypothetical protein [Roseiarcus sp.]
MAFYGFRPYVPVATRRLQALKEMTRLKKQGSAVSPIVIEGRKIARSFWGAAWCDNLERYSDYENRLPRGRTYVRNGSVVDLQIARGNVEALVSGSEIYRVKVDIAVAAPARWKSICLDCAGSVGSLVELLQGKLSKNVMERVCREGDGLFPAPAEIRMSCSCPDWADMCKHVAATLYGVGARLDSDPDLLFTLRGVDRAELVSTVGADLPLGAGQSERVLQDDDVAALFGIDIAAPEATPAPKTREGEGQARGPIATAAPAPPKKAGPRMKAGAAKAPAIWPRGPAKTTSAAAQSPAKPEKSRKASRVKAAQRARSAPA